ncbi:hypothetical protein CHRY9390_02051 [Chryseobacterium aquaeductus]|uniref:DarT domain-containing protein n=1 Tax=Chryseobacterium aquaeductus TaxID=2675056 RepID=A0A9N8MHM0_9FLAO|nr:DUF4433 domain-containing protein [Chryseobacterium aquaeductus]CAA7331352.1 hypothetical protein CHRY9390_02051 [Chryseobacterium potabilaquae]CAD7809689.1 hypothetical protein CHRY9390_02051 [Chryseobacterium aquaeductus]
MTNLKKKYIYRMTHIDNIPHVLEYGITHRNSINANKNFVPIGDNTLINTRNIRKLNNGNLLGEYIPFYFGVRTPMLFVIQKGFNGVNQTYAENIIYCVSSISEIIDSEINFIFTDGHAIDSFSTEYSKNQVKNIDNILDYNAINSNYWIDENDLDKKRRKEAELLLESDLPNKYILGYICFNEDAKTKLINFGIDKNIIVVKPNSYF